MRWRGVEPTAGGRIPELNVGIVVAATQQDRAGGAECDASDAWVRQRGSPRLASDGVPEPDHAGVHVSDQHELAIPAQGEIAMQDASCEDFSSGLDDRPTGCGVPLSGCGWAVGVQEPGKQRGGQPGGWVNLSEDVVLAESAKVPCPAPDVAIGLARVAVWIAIDAIESRQRPAVGIEKDDLDNPLMARQDSDAWPLAASQSRAVWSRPQVASVRPSGLKARSMISSRWASGGPIGLPESVSQSRTEGGVWRPTASVRPSGPSTGCGRV